MKTLIRLLACFAFAIFALPVAADSAADKAGEGPSYQGLWWKGASESGWGMNLTHQGSYIFVTWFTYGADGNGMWLSGLLQRNGATSTTFTGDLDRNDAVSFRTSPWPSATHMVNPTGKASITFTDADHGTFSYTYSYETDAVMDMMGMYGMMGMGMMPTRQTVTQSKAIERQIFAPNPPTCSFSATRTAPYNYSDLWWKPDESGWGISLTHQGNTIFATWFTYGNDGKATWLAGVLSPTSVPGQFSGDPLYSTRGAPLFSEPWDSSYFVASREGSMTLTFTDASHASFAYTVEGFSQTKAIERMVFAPSPSICR